MERILIDKTPRYTFERLDISADSIERFSTLAELRTVYLHKGFCDLELTESGKTSRFTLKGGEGFAIMPNVSYRLKVRVDTALFQATGVVDVARPIYEIIDDGESQKKVPLETSKVIRNPKFVSKPWGHELWIIWTADYYVLKQIGMKAGKQSSLQLHRDKMEANFITEGIADVIAGFLMDPNDSEVDLQASLKGVNLQDYKKRMNAGSYWSSVPGDLHRVISIEDYIAYEVSTPELDDVIRLQDDSGRTSGRIDSEHCKQC